MAARNIFVIVERRRKIYLSLCEKANFLLWEKYFSQCKKHICNHWFVLSLYKKHIWQCWETNLSSIYRYIFNCVRNIFRRSAKKRVCHLLHTIIVFYLRSNAIFDVQQRISAQMLSWPHQPLTKSLYSRLQGTSRKYILIVPSTFSRKVFGN